MSFMAWSTLLPPFISVSSLVKWRDVGLGWRWEVPDGMLRLRPGRRQTPLGVQPVSPWGPKAAEPPAHPWAWLIGLVCCWAHGAWRWHHTSLGRCLLTESVLSSAFCKCLSHPLHFRDAVGVSPPRVKLTFKMIIISITLLLGVLPNFSREGSPAVCLPWCQFLGGEQGEAGALPWRFLGPCLQLGALGALKGARGQVCE